MAPTACTYTVSGSLSLPSPGFFSPFPHGTRSLSVSQEYLALEDGPPFFRQDFSCPALLFESIVHHTSGTGLSPSLAGLSRPFPCIIHNFRLRAPPLSLATTRGISFDFFSSGYLDVSVPPVRPVTLFYSSDGDAVTCTGFPHSDIAGC